MKDHANDLETEISEMVHEITGLYKLKDPSDEKVYLVETTDFSVIFKDKEFMFTFEELWKFLLQRAELKKRHY